MKRSNLVSFSLAFALLAGGPAYAAHPTRPLVKGVDGAEYLPYKPSVVRETQQALEQRQLYSGEIDGVLDAETMRATAEFQRKHGLEASGVPTPLTRKALAIG